MFFQKKGWKYIAHPWSNDQIDSTFIPYLNL